MATLPRSREQAPPPRLGMARDHLAALQLEGGGLSLKPLSLLGVLLIWQLLAIMNGSLHFYNPKLLPSPADIALAGWALAQKGDLQRDLAVSVARVLAGFAIAAPVAVLVGVLV